MLLYIWVPRFHKLSSTETEKHRLYWQAGGFSLIYKHTLDLDHSLRKTERKKRNEGMCTMCVGLSCWQIQDWQPGIEAFEHMQYLTASVSAIMCMLYVWERLFKLTLPCETRKQMARQMGRMMECMTLQHLVRFDRLPIGYMPCFCYKNRFFRKSKHKRKLSRCPGIDVLLKIQKQQALVITSSLAEWFRAQLCHVPDVNSINPLWGRNAIWTPGLQFTAQKDESNTDYLLNVTLLSAIKPWRMGSGGLR